MVLSSSLQSRAVALDVGNLEKKPQGQLEGGWQQTKKQRKKMKRNIQRYILH